MFGFFEKLIDPFPPKPPDRPPTGIYAFCRHYTRVMEPWLALMALLTAFTAVAEALLFGILGKVVDWLASSAPETFIEDTWLPLAVMSIFMLVFIPLLSISPFLLCLYPVVAISNTVSSSVLLIRVYFASTTSSRIFSISTKKFSEHIAQEYFLLFSFF